MCSKHGLRLQSSVGAHHFQAAGLIYIEQLKRRLHGNQLPSMSSESSEHVELLAQSDDLVMLSHQSIRHGSGTRIFADDGGSCQLGSRLFTMLYIFSTATSTCAQPAVSSPLCVST